MQNAAAQFKRIREEAGGQGKVSPVGNAFFSFTEAEFNRAQRVYEVQSKQAKALIFDLTREISDAVREAGARTGDAKNAVEDFNRVRAVMEQRGLSADTLVDPEGATRIKEYRAEMEKLHRAKQATALIDLTRGLRDQTAQALAVTSAEQQELEIRTKIRDFNRENKALDEAGVQAVRERVSLLFQAQRVAAFNEDMRQARLALGLARQKTETDRQALQIEQQIAGFNRTKGKMSAGDAEQYRALMTAKAQAEAYNSLKGSVDPVGQATIKYADDVRTLAAALASGTITAQQYAEQLHRLNMVTRDARDPFQAQVRSLQEAMAATRTNGDYWQEDARTLQTITQLESQGLTLTKEQKEQLLEMNRALHDMQKEQQSGLRGWANQVGSLRDNMLDAAKDMANGLSDAITGALTRAQHPWTTFLQQLSQTMIRLAVNQFLKELLLGLGGGGGALGSLTGSSGGLFGLLGLGGIGAALGLVGSKTSTATVVTVPASASTSSSSGLPSLPGLTSAPASIFGGTSTKGLSGNS